MKTKAFSQYDQQAADFLAAYGIIISIVRADPDGPGSPPAWTAPGEPHGNQYRVTLAADGREPVSFDYWGSIRDQEQGGDATPYDVLACISSDLNCPETFPEFCSDYGYDEDSRKAFATWERCEAFGRELREFFPDGPEREALQEIQ